MKKAVIVFSGYNQRSVIAFLRTLEKNKINYAIIASSDSDTILMSTYANKVAKIRRVEHLDLTELLSDVEDCKKMLSADEYIIAPSTESINRFLLKNRNDFESIGCVVPLVEEILYETVSDKYKFNKICKDNNISLPKEYSDINQALLPLVAKPKRYFSSNGDINKPIIIINKKEKQLFLENFNFNDFYFQDFIFGQCLYLLYYFYKDGSIMKLSQINKIQQPGGGSMIAAELSDFHLSKESVEYEKLFRKINFNGFVMVEIKKENEKYYMIEANPRFWGPSQLFVDANCNLFEAFLFENGLIDNKPAEGLCSNETRYFWHGGLMKSMKECGYVTYHNYSEKSFKNDYKSWLMADVYNRGDTDKIYKQEIG